jgi:hypothetical protein
VWPYEIDVTQRLTEETERNFKDTADEKLLEVTLFFSPFVEERTKCGVHLNA